MPRTARNIADGGLYHLINRGNGQQEIFLKKEDYQAFFTLLLQMSQTYNVQLLAWCLMSNHYHLVVKPERAEHLSQGMHWFQSTHVRRYHRHYGSSGHLWQGRYKSFVIDGDEHLLAVIRYVEANPVRAGMVNSAVDWPWSSHHQRVGTGSEGACPFNSNTSEKPMTERAGTGSAGACPLNSTSNKHNISTLPITLPQPWTEYVDTPMTELEIYKMRNYGQQKTS